MPVGSPLDPWSPRDPITAKHLNQAVNALNKTGSIVSGDQRVLVTNGPSGTVIQLNNAESFVVKTTFQGKIVTSGYSQVGTGCGSVGDFLDNRYWVVSTAPNQRNCENDISNTGSWGMGFDQSTYCCLNLHEAISKTHYLLPGEIVTVFQVETLNSSTNGSQARYIIMETPKSVYGVVVRSPDSHCSGSDFTDSRYYINRVTINNTDTDYQSFVTWSNNTNPVAVETPCDPCLSAGASETCDYYTHNNAAIVVAFNIAESLYQTHAVPPGYIVKLDWTTDSGGFPRYTFNFAIPTATLKISAGSPGVTSLGKGFYYATGYMGSGYAVPTNVSWNPPDNGETVGSTTVIFENLAENIGGTGWALTADTTVQGVLVGYNNDSPPKSIFRGTFWPMTVEVSLTVYSGTGVPGDPFIYTATCNSVSVSSPDGTQFKGSYFYQPASGSVTAATKGCLIWAADNNGAGVYVLAVCDEAVKTGLEVKDCSTGDYTGQTTLKFAKGLSVASTGSLSSIALNITIDPSCSDYLQLNDPTSEGDCSKVLKLCTQTVTVMTGCNSDGSPTYLDVVVLAVC